MSLDACTGGTIYDRRIVHGIRALGWSVDVVDLSRDESFPYRGRLLVVDGLALGMRPGAAQRWSEAATLVALVHHPLCDETGLTNDSSAALRDSERRALQQVHRTIVTSSFTRARLREIGLTDEDDDVRVVEPGVDPPEARPVSSADRPEATLRILTIGSLTPRKAYDDLLRALQRLAEEDWHWTAIGRFDLDVDCATELRRDVAESGFERKVTFLGEISDEAKAEELARADLLIHPAHYEGYGMVVREALAAGVPVVCSTGGALADLRDVAVQFSPGDESAIVGALKSALHGPSTLADWTRAARSASGRVRAWDVAATEFVSALAGLHPSPGIRT